MEESPDYFRVSLSSGDDVKWKVRKPNGSENQIMRQLHCPYDATADSLSV